MKTSYYISALIIAALAFGGGVLAAHQLSGGLARRLIARTGGLSLASHDVHIRRVNMGIGGRDAVVEALVQTGFKFTRDHGKWAVTHVRTGDRQWESVELVRTAIRREKIRRTEAEMRELAAALTAYYREQGSYPAVEDFADLIDALLPRHLKRIIREDYWHRSYRYIPTPTGYHIFSLGPDGKPKTGDDLLMTNGEFGGTAPD